MVVAALVVFFAVAVVFVAMLLRMLGGQVRSMLDAARGIGEGDFSRKVPVLGDDEMAGLASEFNKMSDRLSAQMQELRRQQVEVDRSVRRIGEAFASGLDRQGLLKVVVETALGACGAQYGTIALSGHDGAEAEAGEAIGGDPGPRGRRRGGRAGRRRARLSRSATASLLWRARSGR